MMDITCLTNRLVPVLKRYNIQKAILFGSLARGEATRRSDVDLILIQETKKRFWDRYDGLLLALGQAVEHRAIDVLIYTPQELEQIKERTFIRQALNEGITLYERDEEFARS
ncbi:MAG: nucleotidyltransferase domain-containing protein [Anaerolineales bacterium]|nr:nucleotidyltransferase domain-containing protein [Anaerolineales bacterium]